MDLLLPAAWCRTPAPRPPYRLIVLAAIALLVGLATTCFAGDRDWSGTELAWRDDPRPAADAPAGVEVPTGRRLSRRAQRRITRQREPLDELPVRVAPREAAAPFGFETADPTQTPARQTQAPVSPDGATTAPLHADATLASPFRVSTAGVTPHRDQPYGAEAASSPRHARQRFDIYLPAGCSAGGMPLVVWIHGDSWRDGSKSDCPVTWLAQEGYAVASIGYRPSDAAAHPAQLDDCRAALAEIERNAEVWGIDRDRVAVVGSGAGGHLAALVGLVPAEPPTTADGLDPPRVAAVCAVGAPSDLLTLGPEQDRPGSAASRLVGGPLPEFREAARRASPLAHVSADDPPILVLHGAADAAVPPRQAATFHAALEAAGVDSTLLMLPDAGHTLPLDRSTAGGRALLEFLDRVLGPGLRPKAP